MKPVKSYTNVTGMIADPRTRKGNFAQSALEIDFQIQLSRDPRVVAYRRPEKPIRFRDKDFRKRQHTPDAHVTFTGLVMPDQWSDDVIYEVKTWLDLKENWHEYRVIFEAAREKYRQMGLEYRVVTDKRIRIPYLENAWTLVDRIGCRPDSIADDIIGILTEQPGIAFGELLERFAPERENEVKRNVWCLLARFEVAANLRHVVTYETRLYPAHYATQVMTYPTW